MEIDPQDLKVFTSKLIGVGSYGEVFEGRFRGQDVAVKILKLNSPPEDIASFQQEIQIMQSLRHPNIVLFMGAILRGQMKLLMELMETSLDQILLNNSRHISLTQRFQMALNCANAINWLHSMKPFPIIHRDIRCQNFLVDDALKVKMCDFGLSILKAEKSIQSPNGEQLIHSPAFLAPEIFQNKGFDESCDVYSFGIMFWEILTRQEVYSDVVETYPTPNDLLEATSGPDCLRPALSVLPHEVSNKVKSLMTSCWDSDPIQRPSFSDILEDLREILEEVAILAAAARDFWETNFHKKSKVLWSQFFSAFSQHLQIHFAPAIAGCLQYLLTRGEDEVKIEHFGELIDYFGPLHKRHGDNHFYHTFCDVTRQLWFFGKMGPTEAAARLLDSPPGSYLVRFSTSIRGNFIITQKATDGKEILHHAVEHKPLTSLFSIHGRTYNSLVTLIENDELDFQLPCPGSLFSLLRSGHHDSLSLNFSVSNLEKKTPPSKRSQSVNNAENETRKSPFGKLTGTRTDPS